MIDHLHILLFHPGQRGGIENNMADSAHSPCTIQSDTDQVDVRRFHLFPGILPDYVIDQVVLSIAGNMDVLIIKRFLEEAHGDDN